MNQKYITEIKEEADRLMELTDNPYCQGPVSLLNGVKHVIPILLAEVERQNQQISTLKRALELACAEMDLSDVEKVFAPDYFIRQAQEQEGKK